MTRHRARPSFTVEIKRSRTSPLIDSERPQSEPPVGKPSAGKIPAGKPVASLAAPVDPERKPASPGRNLWAGTGLFEEAAAATQSGRFDSPELSVFSKNPAGQIASGKSAAGKSPLSKSPPGKSVPGKSSADRTPEKSPFDKTVDQVFAAPAQQAAPAKRVLPSLIAPPEPEPEPEAAPEPEAKLPRVRRYRAAEPAPRRAAGPRPAFVWPEDWPDEAPIQTPAPIAVPAVPRIDSKIQVPKAQASQVQVPQVQLPRVQAPTSQGPDAAPGPQGSDAGEIRLRPKRRAGEEDLRIGQRWKRRLPRVCW
ncbi:hypothetical protein FF100_16520 [Methylobacterium terricola]|uniref:Uncharacterized protein n=1 Tax=Methylobacterium terricola TaxID=2583531 RepID=A0A5C4LI46_9HYPH|nr:hypothetical protein [Methylobacterium terricola]TNC12421.1 hypothetical protein FF100_16520 [Methylobacterium terricola]